MSVATEPAPTTTWKGIPAPVLESFAVSQGVAGWRVPYFDRDGAHYRTKLFPDQGDTRWLGESKPQIRYGA